MGRAADTRMFRIERQARPVSDGEDRAEARHREIMEALRCFVAERAPAPPPPNALLLREELKRIYTAIEDTKREIATLRSNGLQGNRGGVGDELAAVVAGTEQATETILWAVEQIDRNAASLIAALPDQPTRNLAADIQDNVVRIFEACNFQDLTGQRIAKVVSAFAFVEARVGRMMEIWGGAESIAKVEPEPVPERTSERALLNGPALEGDADLASQADIDAMFA